MNKTTDAEIISETDSRQQSFHCSKDLQPSYDFFRNGVREYGWLSSLLKNRNGGEVVALIAVIMLSGVPKEFISNKNDGFDSFALIGCLATTAIILTFALIAITMLRAKNLNHAENTQEKQGKKTQLRVSRECTNENGNPER